MWFSDASGRHEALMKMRIIGRKFLYYESIAEIQSQSHESPVLAAISMFWPATREFKGASA